jgi:hypothetical protein
MTTISGLDYERGTGFVYPEHEQGCAIGMLRGIVPHADHRFAPEDVEVLGHRCWVGYVLYAESGYDKDLRANRWDVTPTESGKESPVIRLGVLFPMTPVGAARREEYEQLEAGSQVTFKGTFSSAPQIKAKVTHPDTGEIIERDVPAAGFGMMAIAVDRLDVGDYQMPKVVAKSGVRPIISFQKGRMRLDTKGNDFDLFRYCLWKLQGRVMTVAVRAAPVGSYAPYGLSQTWFTRTPSVLADNYPLIDWSLYVNPLAPPPTGAPQRRSAFQALEGLATGAKIRVHNLQFHVNRKVVRGGSGEIALYVSPGLETVPDKRMAALGGDLFELVVEETGSEPMRMTSVPPTPVPASNGVSGGGDPEDAFQEISPDEIPF